ncbi:hypothetical protein BSKO_02209 [Bryopsis sp. KO-2023]|nr:hypothetical protein BSKO_02209 [Bryopsis sp. KO-2023]
MATGTGMRFSTRALLERAVSHVRGATARSAKWSGGQLYAKIRDKGQSLSSRRVLATTCDVSSPIREGAKLLTLVIVRRGAQVLLGRKKRGFGVGYYNGFGGKVEPGEAILAGAHRELWEECGVRCSSLEKKGIVWFTYDDDSQTREVHVFVTSGSIQGLPSESDEMQPVWFDEDAIPYKQMWEGDRHWLPVLLRDRCFRGLFSFKDVKKLVGFQLHESGALDNKPLDDWSIGTKGIQS